MNYDVFISHASEDKQEVATPLATFLSKLGLKVWIDSMEITLGDSLRRKIDQGLSESLFGVVILSPNFLNKEWPNRELDGLTAREDGLEKIILPVWHNIEKKDVMKYSPTLADKLAVPTTVGIDNVATDILRAIQKELRPNSIKGQKEELQTKSKSSESSKKTLVSKMFTFPKVFIAIFLIFLFYQNQGFKTIENGWCFKTYNTYPIDKCGESAEKKIKDFLIERLSEKGQTILGFDEINTILEETDIPEHNYIDTFFNRSRYIITIAFFNKADSVKIKIWKFDKKKSDTVIMKQSLINKKPCIEGEKNNKFAGQIALEILKLIDL